MASNTGDVKTDKSTSEMADQGTTHQKTTSQTMIDQKTTFESTSETTSETTPKSRHCAFCLKEFVGTSTW
jgi:hypothetical protein